MRLDGIYTGPDVNVPDGIRATGTPDEFRKVGPLPIPGGKYPRGVWLTLREQPDGSFQAPNPQPPYSVDIPAEKPLVDRIAKATEVQCDDQRLIDWMKGEA